MANEWSITVRDATGAIRAVYTPEHPVESIWWSRTGDGGVVDAVIRGRGLDLRPRDIVTIASVLEPGSAFAAKVQYVGWVIEAGDRRDPNVTEWRLASGQWRLGELIETSVLLPAGDIANQARAVAANLPVGVSGWPVEIDHIPLQGFTVGVREPRLETKAEALQALAELVPGFTVPTGESYTYDGVTYDAGDEVPPTTWGLEPAVFALDPNLHVFFRRASGTLVLDEVVDALSVTWDAASGIDVIDRVHVLLFDRPNDGVQAVFRGAAPDAPFAPVQHTYTAPATPGTGTPLSSVAAGVVVPVNALDALRRGSYVATATRTNLSNAGQAFDTDVDTFESNPNPGFVSLSRRASLTTRGARILYSSFAELTFQVSMQAGSKSVTFRTRLPATDGDKAYGVILAPPTQELLDDGLTAVYVSVTASAADVATADAVRIYELENLVLDTSAAEAIAVGKVRYAAQQAGEVIVPNRLAAPAPRVELTLADASVVAAPAALFEYSITREAGFETLVRLNRDLPVAAYTERAALTARLQRLEVRASRS